MTGKNIFSALALTLILGSLYVFFRKDSEDVLIQEQRNRPKMRIVQYDYYRIKDDHELSRAIGNTADLMDQGLLLLRRGVRASRMVENQREEVVAGAVDIQFNEASPGQQSRQMSIKSARAFSGVDVQRVGSRFESEEIQYVALGGVFSSVKPSRFESKGQVLVGNGGFVYEAEKELVKMTNGVSGTVLPTEIQPQARSGRH